MANGGHQTAASLLEAGIWQWNGKEMQVQTALSKVMLDMTYNAEAQRIARESFRRRVPAGYNLNVAPEARGSANTANPNASEMPPKSVSQRAPQTMDHPLVQHAQELFHAEIRSVVNLREEN